MTHQDSLQRLFVQLRGLRNNLPNVHPNNPMEWPQVHLYNELLDKMDGLDIDAVDFRLPQAMLVNERVSTNYLNDETVDTGRSMVTESYIKAKLDALLAYFELNTIHGTAQVKFQGVNGQNTSGRLQ